VTAAGSRERGRDRDRILPWLLGFQIAASAVWILVPGGLGDLAIDRTPTPGAGTANLHALSGYWIGHVVLWAGLTAIWWRLARGRKEDRDGATTRAARWRAIVVILGVAAGLRGLVVATHEPSLSDDLWRYVLDGHALAAGHNPYEIAPAAVEVEDPRFPGEAAVAARTNNPELVTIYLPTSQIAFGIIAGSSPGAEADADDPWRAGARWFRAAFAVVDVVVVALLLALLAGIRASPWWAVLYGWHPLALVEIAGSGHQDVLGLALLLGALLAHQRRTAATAAWTCLIAFAALVKPIAVPITAFLLRGRPLRSWLVALGTGTAACLALLAPFFLFDADGSAWAAFRSTFDRFVAHWAFHGSVYEVLLLLGVEREPARRVCFALVGVVLVAAWIGRHHPWSAARAFLLAALLVSPTAHPWYLLWALVFMPLAPSPTLWVASLTMPAAYVVLGDVVNWTVPGWVGLLTYGPVYGTLGWDWIRRWRDGAGRR